MRAFSSASMRRSQCLQRDRRRPSAKQQRAVNARAAMKSLIFDCDGVILESENLHRRAYNAAFEQFNIACQGKRVNWDTEFYDVLQNQVGGGKPKMRWYFKENGWPTSGILDHVPESEEDQVKLIDTLQDWKSENYRELIGSGQVAARPGVLRLMDEARANGLKLAVCSAATKGSVVFTLRNLIGDERFDTLDCFLAGDDVKEKKPSPTIYIQAAEALGVKGEECVVIEDSQIGVDAAIGAGMRCIVTYTSSSKVQKFGGAEKVVAELGDEPPVITVQDLMAGTLSGDDR